MHLWSKLFIPTLREAPADAEVASHKFLVRAGYVRQLSAGIYSYLFLAQRSILKITGIVRQEMDKIGQEFYLPALNPREVWEASGRWSVMGDNMFRLKDRKGADLCLAMTHEEVMTEIARKELRSYKQLPQIWYQIQTKFRDEPRPKSGLLRVRQFTMKDAYSFDIDAAGLDASYEKNREAYKAIFSRCGLNFVIVKADSGAMGGSGSEEFMVHTEAGEDLIASCEKCDYAANIEKATSKLEAVADLAPEGDGAPLLVHTPGMKTIDEVAKFLGVSPKNKMKTMAMMAEVKAAASPSNDKSGKPTLRPIVVMLRGDHSLSEAKLAAAVGGALPGAEIRPMVEDEIKAVFHSPAGFLGPVGLVCSEGESQNIATLNKDGKSCSDGVILLVDVALQGRANLISGANKEDYHLKNVTPGRDFTPTGYADLRPVNAGETCPECGEGKLTVAKAVEIGHIFKLGYKYSQSMGASVLDSNGKEVTPIMGSYGIGIERILTSAIEQNHDADGFWLPPSIAPFSVVVVPTNIKDELLMTTAQKIATDLEAAGHDVLLDDRDERAGVKFKDADLVGIPYRVNVGKTVVDGKVEVVTRATKERQEVAIADVAATLNH